MKKKINMNIHEPLNCKCKNLIYLIECKKCGKQNIGETKRHLHQRFVQHRHSILNYGQFPNPTPVSEHINQVITLSRRNLGRARRKERLNPSKLK